MAVCVYFLVKYRIEKCHLTWLILCDESKEDLLEILNEDFNTLKKFDDYIKVLSFYHVERCEQDNCSQCLFAFNLCYVYTEHVIQEKKDVKEFRNYSLCVKIILLLLKYLFVSLQN